MYTKPNEQMSESFYVPQEFNNNDMQQLLVADRQQFIWNRIEEMFEERSTFYSERYSMKRLAELIGQLEEVNKKAYRIISAFHTDLFFQTEVISEETLNVISYVLSQSISETFKKKYFSCYVCGKLLLGYMKEALCDGKLHAEYAEGFVEELSQTLIDVSGSGKR